jgi:hypothetical protein
VPARALIVVTLLFLCSCQQIAATPPQAAENNGVTESTVNEFIPVDRSISDCVSAAPKPGCGSDARGGWRQGVVMILLVLALSFIGWRIITNVRRAPS